VGEGVFPRCSGCGTVALDVAVETTNEECEMIEEIKVNASELARKTGYHRSHILRVIRGETSGSVKCLSEISKVLGMSVDHIIRMIRKGKIHV
jgi:plasmid maintenance system antidote protein VapI